MVWEPAVREKFEQMLAKVPVFLRGLAQDKVGKKAEELAAQAGRPVSEKDMVDAFFLATPFGFHGPMKTDMKDLGLDYERHGHGS